MKDSRDPGTLELPLPRKKGRKPLGDRAMTTAERQKRWREQCALRAERLVMLTPMERSIMRRLLRDDLAAMASLESAQVEAIQRYCDDMRALLGKLEG